MIAYLLIIPPAFVPVSFYEFLLTNQQSPSIRERWLVDKYRRVEKRSSEDL